MTEPFYKSGHDKFLRRGFHPVPERTGDESSAEFSRLPQEILARNIKGDKLEIDYKTGQVSILGADSKRVNIGNLDGTGKYGIRVKDSKGNVRFESSDGTEVFSMFDADNEKEIVRLDEFGLTVKDVLENNLVKITSSGLFVYDTSGNILVQLDGTGLIVNTGKITVKNEDETTIIDSGGLVSNSANFNFGSIYLDEPADFTSMTWADIPNTSQTFNLSRTSRVLFMVSVLGNTDAGTGDVRMAITGITQGNIVPILHLNSTGNVNKTNFIHRIFEVPAATPVTFKLQADLTAPATAMQFGGGYITSTFLVLGT